MHDLKEIRDNPDRFDAGLARRGLAPRAAEILALDAKSRALTTELQDLQTKRNSASKAIGAAKAKKDEAEAQRLLAEVEGVKQKMPKLEESQGAIQRELDDILAAIPNLPAADAPDGKDETENVEVQKWPENLKSNASAEERLAASRADARRAEVKKLSQPKEHFDIGEAMGLMDFETAAKMSGARFVLLKGALARMERAIANLMLDTHTGEFGYMECVPPLLIKDNAAYGTGQLPKFAADLFETSIIDFEEFSRSASANLATQLIQVMGEVTGSEPGNRGSIEEHFRDQIMRDIYDQREKIAPSIRYLIPTAEVSLTNIVADAILDEGELPLRFTAWTPCFRSEAGAAGKDTRGMIRMHQFSKVELVSITAPEKSNEEHERMTACAEAILKKLELPFRTVALCTGDMGFASRKTYDIEVWLPGQNRYREISSCSNCGDFQARRMKARFRRRDPIEGIFGVLSGGPISGGSLPTRPQFVHTLNGSGLAVGRTLVAVLENYQQEDGSVAVPDALVPYMGGTRD